MKPYTPGARISLNASYYFAPLCQPMQLMEDANLLLGSARGITQTLSDLMGQDTDIDPGELAEALWGVSVLVQMGQSNVEGAQRQIHRLRKAVPAPREKGVKT